MEAVRSWRGSHSTAGALAIIVALGVMLDTIWTGDSGSSCKSSISTSHTGR
jgi:hypothetical protein